MKKNEQREYRMAMAIQIVSNACEREYNSRKDLQERFPCYQYFACRIGNQPSIINFKKLMVNTMLTTPSHEKLMASIELQVTYANIWDDMLTTTNCIVHDIATLYINN